MGKYKKELLAPLIVLMAAGVLLYFYKIHRAEIDLNYSYSREAQSAAVSIRDDYLVFVDSLKNGDVSQTDLQTVFMGARYEDLLEIVTHKKIQGDYTVVVEEANKLYDHAASRDFLDIVDTFLGFTKESDFGEFLQCSMNLHTQGLTIEQFYDCGASKLPTAIPAS